MFRSWLGGGVVVIVCSLLAFFLFVSSNVGAPTGDEAGKFAGLEIRLVRAAAEHGRDGREVVVEGEITNRTDSEVAVPAVRIALMSGEVERRIWYHEPSQMRLVAGDALHFRSVLAAPPAQADKVAFRLADRRNIIVGMN